MERLVRHDVLVALMLAAAAFFGEACASGKCSGVTCGQFDSCDPTDGLCKCGGRQGGDGGLDGVVCAAGQTCNGTLQQCVSDLCSIVNCSNGNSCTPSDGICRCGGTVCGAGEPCDQFLHQCVITPYCQNVLCAAGESCDPTSGNCLCGSSAGCTGGQACLDGACAVDLCFGLHCSGAGMACYAGVCRCGGSTGPACNQDEVCKGNACVLSAKCIGVSCTSGNLCSAADGLCHCAAVDGPICSGGSTCSLFFQGSGQLLPNGDSYPDSGIVGLCLGGNLCASVNAGRGCLNPLETCDPNTGACLCGAITDAGPLPPNCAGNTFCASIDGGAPPQCFEPCDPYAQNCPTLAPSDGGANGGAPDASLVQGCYYEPWMNALVCEPSTSPTSYESLACKSNSDCIPGQDCFPLSGFESDSGYYLACRNFCDNFDGGQHLCIGVGNGGSPVRECVPVAVVTDDAGNDVAVGACQPYPDGG